MAIREFANFLNEGKPKGAPEWHDSDAPDAEGRFRDLSPKDLAAWLIKTRKKDLKKITGSLNQQIVFNRKEDPDYAEKMEKTRKEVYKQLGREDLLKNENKNMDNIRSFNEFLFEGIDASRLGRGIAIWGKPDNLLMKELGKDLFIPKKNGEITWKGKKIGYADSFSGINFTDIDWIKDNLKSLDKVTKKTGFWYAN